MRDLLRALDELAEDYDQGAAEHLTASMSVAEIRQALARLQSQPNESPLRTKLLGVWAAKEPEAAWEAALALSEKGGRASALAAVAGEIAKTRPEAAMELAMSLSMGKIRQNTLNSVFLDWAEADMPRALDYLKRHPDLPVEDYTFINAIHRLAKSNPMQAAQQAVMLPPSDSRDAAIRLAFDSWYSKDAAAARRWALDQTDPVLRTAALQSLISAMANDNPRDALAFLSQNDFSGRFEAQNTIVRTWLEKDPMGIFDYLATHPQDKNDVSLMYHIGSAVIRATPQEQAELLAKLPESDFKHTIVRQMADQEVERGRYPKAVAALNGLPDSTYRDASLQNLGKSWAKNDPQAAATWLRLQPDSTDRDLVIGGYATTLAKTDPQAAIQWAQAIPDPQIQTTVFKNIAIRWMYSNPQAALPWLESLNLPQAQKDAIIRDATSGDDTFFNISVQNRR